LGGLGKVEPSPLALVRLHFAVAAAMAAMSCRMWTRFVLLELSERPARLIPCDLSVVVARSLVRSLLASNSVST